MASLTVAFLFQLENLQASYEELKAQSQEEIRRLWSQLESVRPDRQDPSGEDFVLEAETLRDYSCVFLIVEAQTRT